MLVRSRCCNWPVTRAQGTPGPTWVWRRVLRSPLSPGLSAFRHRYWKEGERTLALRLGACRGLRNIRARKAGSQWLRWDPAISHVPERLTRLPPTPRARKWLPVNVQRQCGLHLHKTGLGMGDAVVWTRPWLGTRAQIHVGIVTPAPAPWKDVIEPFSEGHPKLEVCAPATVSPLLTTKR